MDLKSYLTPPGGKLIRADAELQRIASLCGVTPYYLFMLASGHKKASAELAANIEHATHGVVDRRVTLPEFPWDSPTAVPS